MGIFQKSLIGLTAVSILAGAASAQIVIQPVINAAPAYAPPPPGYYVQPGPYVAAPWVEGYDPHHRYHDYRYWHDHRDHWDHGRDEHRDHR